jgi:hypothetical protein
VEIVAAAVAAAELRRSHGRRRCGTALRLAVDALTVREEEGLYFPCDGGLLRPGLSSACSPAYLGKDLET